LFAVLIKPLFLKLNVLFPLIDPLVSSDIIGRSSSAVVDAASTKVVSDDLLYLSAWYDNEWAYSCRLVELAVKVGR